MKCACTCHCKTEVGELSRTRTSTGIEPTESLLMATWYIQSLTDQTDPNESQTIQFITIHPISSIMRIDCHSFQNNNQHCRLFSCRKETPRPTAEVAAATTATCGGTWRGKRDHCAQQIQKTSCSSVFPTGLGTFEKRRHFFSKVFARSPAKNSVGQNLDISIHINQRATQPPSRTCASCVLSLLVVSSYHVGHC